MCAKSYHNLLNTYYAHALNITNIMKICVATNSVSVEHSTQNSQGREEREYTFNTDTMSVAIHTDTHK